MTYYRLLLAILFALPCASALAQPGFDDDAQKRATERVKGMKDLELTETQQTKLVKLFVKEQGRSRRDHALMPIGLHPRSLRPLKLDKKQKMQIDIVLDEVGDKLVSQWRSQRKKGEQGEKWGYPQWRAFRATLRKQADMQIGEFLTDEQRKRFAKQAAKHEADSKRRFEEWARREKARKEGRTGEGETRKESAKDEIARRLTAAMKALALDDEEAAAIRPMIEALIKHRVLGRRGRPRRSRVAAPRRARQLPRRRP